MTYLGQSIVISHEFPPIPDRRFDFGAVLDGYDGGDPVGRGPSEADAIADLVDQLEEARCESSSAIATSNPSTGESSMIFEVKERKQSTGEWIVGAVDHDSEGEMYIAIFTGFAAEKCAREYAHWKNYSQAIPAHAICLFLDGDQWSCVYADHINLQESPAGFGRTHEEAIDALRASSENGTLRTA